MTAAAAATTGPSGQAVERFVAFRRLAVALVAAVVLLDLVGWAVGSRPLEGGFGAQNTMKVNTALALASLVAGIALVRRRRAAGILAGFTAFVGVGAGAEYLFGAGRGLDELLVRDPAAIAHPGRPAVNTAACLVLLGGALALACSRRPRRAAASAWLAVGELVVVLAATVGLLTGTRELYGRADLSYMSLWTILCLGLAGAAMVVLRTDVGVGAALAGADLRGTLLRRLLPAAVAVPLALAAIRELLIRGGLDPGVARWSYSLAIIVLLSAGVAVAALVLGRGERARLALTERLSSIVGTSPLAVITLDERLFVTSWNPAAERMFGWTAAEVVGRPYPLASADEWDDVRANAARVVRGATTVERERSRRDGSRMTLRFDSAPLADGLGGEPGILTVVTDVSDRVAAQNQLRRLNEELERRVLERTAELSAMNEELKAFSYSVSHDLRAPLRSLSGFSEAMLDDYADRLDERGRDYLRRIQAAAMRMGTLIDDVLALSRVTRAELVRRDVDVSALARSIASDLAAAEPSRVVDVEVADGLHASADPTLLAQALQNLLENAWKFTAPVECARIEVGADGGELYVRDNGVGFDAAYADNLFVPFQRLHSAAEFAGNGVGLATVASIVRRHGGEVRAESAPGEGAFFSFSLGADAVLHPRQPLLATTGGSHA